MDWPAPALGIRSPPRKSALPVRLGGPGNGDVARRQQPAHHGLRAPAHRQDRDQSRSRADASHRALLFQGTELSTIRPPPSSRGTGHHGYRGPVRLAVRQYERRYTGRAHRQHSCTWPGSGTGSGRRQCARAILRLFVEQQQRHQSASRFHHLPGAINYAGGRRRQLQRRQRDLGHRKDLDRNRGGYAGQYHHGRALDLEFVESDYRVGKQRRGCVDSARPEAGMSWLPAHLRPAISD